VDPPPPPVGDELAAGVALWTGADELWTDDDEETGVLATDELLVFALVADDVLLGVVLGLAFGFLGGACRAGTAAALVNGVMLAC
jgi:hypothetical protein